METSPGNDEFTAMNNQRPSKRARRDNQNPILVNGPLRPAKVKPLILDGLTKGESANPLVIRDVLKEAQSHVAKTVTTKQGKILVFAKSEEANAKLLEMKLRSGVALRQAKDSKLRQNNFVVILGVNPTIDDKAISAELGRQCKRIVSKQQGAATWKVKLQCSSAEEKQALLQSGVSIGLSHYKAIDYTMKQGVLQCYQCQLFGHIAAVCKSVPKCQKCGGEHGRQECVASEPKCANCAGAHTASSFECPWYARHQLEKETAQVSYADKVKKGGDKTDCLRLSCSIATSIATVVNLRLPVTSRISVDDIAQIVAQNVAYFYKVQILPEHVHAVGFLNRAASEPIKLSNNGC